MAVSRSSSSGLPANGSASSRLCGRPAAAVVSLLDCLCFRPIANQSKARATMKAKSVAMAIPATAPKDRP